MVKSSLGGKKANLEHVFEGDYMLGTREGISSNLPYLYFIYKLEHFFLRAIICWAHALLAADMLC